MAENDRQVADTVRCQGRPGVFCWWKCERPATETYHDYGNRSHRLCDRCYGWWLDAFAVEEVR